MNFTNTIAAISTPMGEGGIGIIRISGDKALQTAYSILRTSKGKTIQEIKDHQIYYGVVVSPKTAQPIDEVLYFYAKKPRSFTAEDIIEIQAHGGMLLLNKILNTILEENVRMAEPGEFTMRAFMNGRIDLVQAESIIDLIRAKTDKAHQLAIAQLSGKTTDILQKTENDLYDILIRIEALLDFPEDDIPELERDQIINNVEKNLTELKLMLNTIDEGRKIREGINITIVGRPNVGKSSLLNAFIQEEKAIVTDIPGTTRDAIDVQLQLRGVPIVLTDTAGLHDTENEIEKIGIEKAEESLSNAQFVLVVLDGSQPLTEEDHFVLNKLQNKKVLLIINKSDLPQQISNDDLNKYNFQKMIHISALTRTGFENLEDVLVEQVGIGNLQVDDRPMLSRIRHKKSLLTAISALQNFVAGLTSGQSEDLLAIDLHTCLDALGEITGKNVSEQVLKGIFSKFCIGK